MTGAWFDIFHFSANFWFKLFQQGATPCGKCLRLWILLICRKLQSKKCDFFLCLQWAVRGPPGVSGASVTAGAERVTSAAPAAAPTPRRSTGENPAPATPSRGCPAPPCAQVRECCSCDLLGVCVCLFVWSASWAKKKRHLTHSVSCLFDQEKKNEKRLSQNKVKKKKSDGSYCGHWQLSGSGRCFAFRENWGRQGRICIFEGKKGDMGIFLFVVTDCLTWNKQHNFVWHILEQKADPRQKVTKHTMETEIEDLSADIQQYRNREGGRRGENENRLEARREESDRFSFAYRESTHAHSRSNLPKSTGFCFASYSYSGKAASRYISV